MSIDDQTKLLTEIRDILQGHDERLAKIDRENEEFRQKVLLSTAVTQRRWLIAEFQVFVLIVLALLCTGLLASVAVSCYRFAQAFGH